MVKLKHIAVPITLILCVTVTFLTDKAIRFDESEGLSVSVSSETKSDAEVILTSHEVSDLNKDEVRNTELNVTLPKNEKTVEKQFSYNWTSVVSFAGIVDSSIITDALNKDKIDVNDMKHLPVHRIDTRLDIEKFKLMYCDENLIKRSYDEVPSFEDITSDYDEKFFEDYSLLIVYMTAYSGSLRFDVGNIDFDGDSICVYIEQTNNPSVCTDDAPGWFVTVVIEDDALSDCKSFDAVLG